MLTSERPLWQLLAIISRKDSALSLTCDECFTVLEYIASVAARGVNQQALLTAVNRHHEHCPECWDHHLEKLRQIEAEWAQVRVEHETSHNDSQFKDGSLSKDE